MPISDMKRMLRIVRNADLIVSPRYQQYILSHADDPLTPEVADIIRQQLVATPRVRSASFAGSAGGQCARRQIYSFLGVPSGDTIDPRLANIYVDGKWRHLRIQAQMLMAGIIQGIEFPLVWKDMRDRGTMDGYGVVPDDHPKVHYRGKTFGLEIKGSHPSVYQKLINEGPGKFSRQYHRYFLSGGWDLFVVFLENKATQDYTEWVIEPDESIMEEQHDELKLLNKYVDQQHLPPRLTECKGLSGQTFRDCPFGGRTGPCARINSWEGSVNAAKKAHRP